ncbi:MAG TPA: antibiotic biosynthesis monooxygenase [Bryobacteraceae bacterium]|nr:antibiotic biosynthesis monooxygenase [Bryobacteraceae bacterium]
MQRLLLLLMTTVLLCAQAPPDGAAYSVAYIEILPASRTAAITAMKQYRDASRKDNGFQRIELFEQVGRPAHFSIIETWANSRDLDAHAAAASTKDFRNKIDSMRLSDYDQRPYKTLSLGAPRNDASSRSTFVITHVDIGAQGTSAGSSLSKLAEDSRKEAGNLRFDVVQHAMRANHFTVIEEWQNAKEIETHAAATHTKEYRNSVGPILGSPLDERFYKAVE